MKKILLIVMLVFVSDIQAQELENDVLSLKGIKGVYLLIHSPKDGLNESQLQTDVELKLRMAGIKVLTKVEWANEPGSPLLYIRVFPTYSESNLAYSFIEISLLQVVYLERDIEIMINGARTWYTIKFVGTTDVVNHIRDDIKNMVDIFINDYLTANPK